MEKNELSRIHSLRFHIFLKASLLKRIVNMYSSNHASDIYYTTKAKLGYSKNINHFATDLRRNVCEKRLSNYLSICRLHIQRFPNINCATQDRFFSV